MKRSLNPKTKRPNVRLWFATNSSIFAFQRDHNCVRVVFRSAKRTLFRRNELGAPDKGFPSAHADCPLTQNSAENATRDILDVRRACVPTNPRRRLIARGCPYKWAPSPKCAALNRPKLVNLGFNPKHNDTARKKKVIPTERRTSRNNEIMLESFFRHRIKSESRSAHARKYASCDPLIRFQLLISASSPSERR